MQRTYSRLLRKENLTGWAFIAPALVTFLVLTAFPFFLSLFLSFTKWNFLSGWDHIRMIGTLQRLGSTIHLSGALISRMFTSRILMMPSSLNRNLKTAPSATAEQM